MVMRHDERSAMSGNKTPYLDVRIVRTARREWMCAGDGRLRRADQFHDDDLTVCDSRIKVGTSCREPVVLWLAHSEEHSPCDGYA
jgi:hypothetical protein